jgi:DNA polymerase III subunit alpha
MDSGDGVAALRDILAREEKGRGQVSIVVTEPAREIELKLPGAWMITGKCRAAIKSLPGIVEVQEL